MTARNPRYIVRYSPSAQAEYDRLAPIPRRNVKGFRELLRYGPYLRESMQLELQDRDDMWRIAFGDWRIVFRLDKVNREIEITRVRPRAVAYIGLERPPRQ